MPFLDEMTMNILQASTSSRVTAYYRGINLACGGKLCHQAGWINADHNPCAREVLQVDLLAPLPFPDKTFDVVYHSQFIEHLPAELAVSFMKECHRILKPMGVMRIVTPDLRNQAHEYLSKLAAVLAAPDDEDNRLRYDWIRLEMLDQLTRHTSGGEMVGFLRNSGHRIQDYLWERMGRSGKNLIPPPGDAALSASFKNLLRAIRNGGRSLRRRIMPRALALGRFRLSGECHLCMYDEYSLSTLLVQSGFQHIAKVSALESRIPDWNRTLLDCDEKGYPDGKVSLFMEAVRRD
jgi:predicted SAM-dependent methyltransferase